MCKKFLFLLFFIASLFTACTKDDDLIVEPPIKVQPEEGLVKPIGAIQGNSTGALIGSEGGSISSEDQRLKIEIPAGALSSSQNITIQPIENTNPSGLGKAYRITPHDITFDKPVKVIFSYDNEEISSGMPEALMVSYQNNKGVWKVVGGLELNKSAKTIAVNTTHFSDWSFFEALTLEPVSAVIKPGENIQLKVFRFLPFKVEHLLTPLVEGEELALPGAKEAEAEIIDNWTITGAGNLAPSGSKAIFTAPASVQGMATATISVKIKSTQHLLL